MNQALLGTRSLAVCYDEGEGGVEQNRVLALSLMKQAALRGEIDAVLTVERRSNMMTLDESILIPFDGRMLDPLTAEATLLTCIADLERGECDALSEWLLVNIMDRSWGDTPTVRGALRDFNGSQADGIF